MIVQEICIELKTSGTDIRSSFPELTTQRKTSGEGQERRHIHSF